MTNHSETAVVTGTDADPRVPARFPFVSAQDGEHDQEQMAKQSDTDVTGTDVDAQVPASLPFVNAPLGNTDSALRQEVHFAVLREPTTSTHALCSMKCSGFPEDRAESLTH